MNNIKGLILDIDGVLVGEKIGFNSPTPHPDILNALKQIKNNGLFISLCTAKPHYAIKDIIVLAGLNNLHITDGGGVITDPIDNVIVKKHIVNNRDALEVIKTYLDNDVYTEFYSLDSYFMQENQLDEITITHAHILQRPPEKVISLLEKAKTSEITKIMPIAINEKDKERLISLFAPHKNKLSLNWGLHPIALPHIFGIITAQGISKKQGAIEIAAHEKMSFDNILGVGDSASDWDFIQLCRYAGAMGNAQQKLKDAVNTKEQSFIGESVDENGILGILSHFGLLSKAG